MIKRKRRLLILLLLVTSVLLIPWAMSAFMFDATAATTCGSTNQSTQNNSSQVKFGNIRLTEHKITAPELATLESEVGVYQQGKNYNQIVDGHGSGLQPPTADEWNAISESTYVVNNVSYANAQSSADNSITPSAVDNSQSPYFPPIGNQGSQGSCAAWSVGYYITTFQAAKEHGWNLTGATWSGNQPTASYQKEIISPAFVYNLINNGQDGGSSWYSAIQLVCFIGASSWMNMPYNQNDYTSWPSQAAWTEAPLYRGNSSGYQQMPVTDGTGINNLKTLLASGNLVSIDVDSNEFTNLSSNDVWTLDNYNATTLNHAGTIVGYDDNFSYVESGQVRYGAFKVANSWGLNGWEPVPTGFYWISYAAMEQRVKWCYYYFDQSNYQPDLLATFELNDNARGNCMITVGLGNPNNPIITKCFTTYISGGDQPFCTNNIVMDISEFGAYVPTLYNQRFYLQVYDTGGYASANGTIMYFAIGNCIASGTPFQTVKGQNVFLNVTYNPQYQLTMSTNYGTVSPASGTFYGGNTFNITATPPTAGPGERYVFLGWTGSGVGSYTGLNNPASVTMNSNITETASWTNQYYLTVSSAYGTPSGAGWYNSGTSAYASTPLVVAGPTGTQYVFTGWSGDASGTSSTSNPITMNGPKTATANWQTQYNLTFVQSGVGLDFSGHFITVNGTAYNRAGFSTWANPGTVYTFSYSPLLTVTANGEQYVLTGISGNSTASSLTVSAPTTVIGAYQAQFYLTATSTYDSPSPSSGWFNNGSSITEFVASPISGGLGTQYTCSGWSGSGSVPASGNMSAVTFAISAPSTITWNWVTQYYLTVNSAYGTPSGQGWYTSGASASFNVPSPVGGVGVQYVFSNWSGSGSGSYNGSSVSPSVTMNAPITETASWITQYYLTVASAYGVPSGSGWYNSGATAYAGLNVDIVSGGTGTQYIFNSWTGSASGSGYLQSNNITMNAPLTTTASWITQYYLTVASAYGVPSGSGWYNSGATSYAGLSSGAVSDGPSTQYAFSFWSTGGTNYAQSNGISMNDAPVTTTASWNIQYQITFAVVGGGSPSPIGSNVWENTGSLPITATSNSGYTFSNWSSNTGSITFDNANSASATATIGGTGTITATFAINTYNITVTQGANGVIAPGTTTVDYGGSQAFTITPNTGYSIASLTVDGSSVAVASSYTFSSVQASHSITATFTLTPTQTPIPTPTTTPTSTLMPTTTPIPTTSSSPTPTPNSTPLPVNPGEPNGTQIPSSIPQGAIYGIVAAVVSVAIVAVVLVLRISKKGKS